ncbi:DUF2815 domain-containing protein [Mesorhizobium sp. SARCC-RB16n]|uniref:DUF2815 domain-containing protein n=1 Tax=Mesorhizobium sp. SARCC-RB16n TaxID=2116687 RepID=UPI00122F9E81|nr:DUF2815 domain-containing protein [Mesorhizobium sp. SARCC-RB16n]KAA3452706.1 DUF2815 domain-containing protein [Mesorhizobium sp. SARCC-RB16n]
MANDTKKKSLPSFTSPRLVFVYPKLTEPDYGNKDFPKPDGEYSLKGKMSAAALAEFTARKNKDNVSLDDLYEEAKRDAEKQFAELSVKTRKEFEKKNITGPVMNSLFETLYDKESEEETGEVCLKFTKKASGIVKKGPREGKKWTSAPDIYDARGKKMVGKLPNIWGGSEGKVSFAVSSYFIPGTAAAGLKLMLNGVQIIDLVSNGSRSADSHGFGEEDGYGYDPSEYQDENEGEDKSEGGSEGGKSAGEEDF